MSLLKVEGEQTVSQIETLLGQMVNSSSCDVQIPTTLRRSQFAGLALLIQFLVTWAKQCPNGRLFTHVQNPSDTEGQLRALSETDHGAVALLAAPRVVQVKGQLIYEAERYALRAVRANHTQFLHDLGAPSSAHSAALGPSLSFLCADGPELYPPSLYHSLQGRRPFLVDATDFGTFAETCFRRLTHTPIPQETRTALGLILYEVFRNTDDWARENWDDTAISRSIRGLRFEVHHHKEADAFRFFSRGSRPLETFFTRHPVLEDQRLHTILEISVFDSGSGLAQRWLRRSLDGLTAIDEYHAVIECLKPHKSSSAETHRGIGLHDVMLALTGC